MSEDWERWLGLDEPGFLPAQDHAARRARLQESLARLAPPEHTAALHVTGAANLRWATGFTGSAGALLVTPDSATLLTDARYEGRAAIEDYFGASPPFSDFQTVLLEIEGAEDLAYVWGSYSMNVELPDMSSSLPERGKFLEIWRKQEDGSWRIERDVSTRMTKSLARCSMRST